MASIQKQKTYRLVQLALLLAVELIFAFTPLGYLHIGIVEITFMSIPVALSAMLLGPLASFFLGTVFGISSFVQCFGISVFGTAIFAFSSWKALVLCLLPRMLMGLLCGWIFKVLSAKKTNSVLAFGATAFASAFLNTVGFILCFFILFRNANLDFGGTVFEIGKMNLWDVVLFLAGINGVVEMIAVTVIAAPLGKALSRILSRG